MWTRKELKIRAKEALRRNYWRIMLVAALAALLSGGISYSTSSSSSAAQGIVVANVDKAEDKNGGYKVGTEDTADVTDRMMENMEDASTKMNDTEKTVFVVSVIVVVLVICFIVFVVMFAFIELLYNPFYVGAHRFMLKSVDDRAEVKEVAYGFDHSYKNIVKTMFHVDMRVFLWALLFVIPGIYKRYQYRMVSYILAEHPDMDYKKVLLMSSDMMNGEKWHTFVLDLSFILWHMLGMITCGMIELFYVTPYVWLTNAALYRRLCELHDSAPQGALPGSSFSDGEV